jgi:hypothetical protein
MEERAAHHIKKIRRISTAELNSLFIILYDTFETSRVQEMGA